MGCRGQKECENERKTGEKIKRTDKKNGREDSLKEGKKPGGREKQKAKAGNNKHQQKTSPLIGSQF